MSQSKYFAVYADLLGISADMTDEGSSYLFDYYGGAWYCASKYPSIIAYLFSDSFVAFLQEGDNHLVPEIISSIISHWSADALPYQCFVGFGTFTESRSNYGSPVRNFFGAEIHGTALVDAVAVAKTKPLGSRVFVSKTACKHLPDDENISTIHHKRNNQTSTHVIELFPKEFDILSRPADGKQTMIRDKSGLFYERKCHLHLLNLCKYISECGIRKKHDFHSVASCVMMIGHDKFIEMLNEFSPEVSTNHIQMIIDRTRDIVDDYVSVVI